MLKTQHPLKDALGAFLISYNIFYFLWMRSSSRFAPGAINSLPGEQVKTHLIDP